jgi:N-acetylneuraminic acid mutarotase
MRTRELRLPESSFCGCVLAFAFASISAGAQTVAPYEWTWMGGSNSASNNAGQFGVYGKLATPAAGNVPGGTRDALSWTDVGGNLWLFGGMGNTVVSWGISNGLWEFRPSTNEWARMGGTNIANQRGVYGKLGSPAATNFPGARVSAETWTDKSGNLWLFSGIGIDAVGKNGFLNDIWEFRPSTHEWTWKGGSSIANYCHQSSPETPPVCFNIHGGVYGTLGKPAAGNIPGARTGAVTWTDKSGNLWLFGGGGFDADGNHYLLNDLWKFSPATDEWTWMGGTSTLPGIHQLAAPGVYGTLGTPTAANIPSGRSGAMGWTDTSGNLWLFGGTGFVPPGSPPTGKNNGGLNDLWRFNPATVAWTWMGGGSAIDQPGVYGALDTPAADITPGGRAGALSWTDKHGDFWLFGGECFDAEGHGGFFNDLWEFNPTTSLWAWMGGSSTVGCCFTAGSGCVRGQPGVYGALGAPSAGNIPGSRTSAVTWTDNKGDLWLFGGQGFDGKGDYGILNDVWELQPSQREQKDSHQSSSPAVSRSPDR